MCIKIRAVVAPRPLRFYFIFKPKNFSIFKRANEPTGEMWVNIENTICLRRAREVKSSWGLAGSGYGRRPARVRYAGGLSAT